MQTVTTFAPVALGDICSLRSETVLPQEFPNLPYVGLEHLDSGSPILNRHGHAKLVSSGKFRFYAGDVLFGKLRPNLEKAALAEFEGICSTDILVLKPGPRILSSFLAYLVHTRDFVDHAVASTSGVNLPRTSWSSLANFQFPLPPLQEQAKITSILDAIQGSVELRRRELALERERKAALMHHLFTHGTRGEPTKQTEIGEMPESWQVVELGAIAEIAYGLTVNESRRKSVRRAPYLTVANVSRGALHLDEVKEIGMLNGDEENYRLRKGDILFIEGSGNPALLGSAAVWNDELPFALHQNHLIRARLDQSVAFPEWVMNYVNSDFGRSQLLGKGKTSSGLHNINSRVISHIRIPMPTTLEQQAIVEVLLACDRSSKTIEREILVLDEFFHALLEELISGHLAVQSLM